MATTDVNPEEGSNKRLNTIISYLENNMFVTSENLNQAYGNLLRVIPENNTAVTVTMLHIFMNTLAQRLKEIKEGFNDEEEILVTYEGDEEMEEVEEKFEFINAMF